MVQTAALEIEVVQDGPVDAGARILVPVADVRRRRRGRRGRRSDRVHAAAMGYLEPAGMVRRRRVRRDRRIVVDGVGHFPHREAPDAVAQALSAPRIVRARLTWPRRLVPGAAGQGSGCTLAGISPGNSTLDGPRGSNAYSARYGNVTAILRKANRQWRVMLKATNPKCLEVPLPDVVRSDRVICKRIFPAVRNIP